MIEAMHYTAAGNERDARFALPSETFDGTVNEAALYSAVVAWRNNQRQGTAKTKTRSEISGGNQKPWKQKGTGRARQGTTRAPHWRGGGIVFGPQPRKYTTELPRKLRQLARKSALNARAREGNMAVVEKLVFDAPKTGLLAGLLARVGAAGEKVLVLTHGHNANVYLSGRNIPTVEVMNYADASAYDILWSDKVVVEEAALTGVEPEVTERPEAGAVKAGRPVRKAAKAPKAAKQPKAAKAAAKAPKKKSVKKTKAAPAKGKAKSARRAPKKKGGK
ncbi:MAG TPA: 50S ribosomal protein L4 [Gemmatimonadales bacterium]|jgi:large subunit ribosomal protein L4|nr:50S ribosomal protein L4 [Gemmatimonadales bacterium]